jgi:prepilin-type N-terminal cleavage/methylation domain-containing protein
MKKYLNKGFTLIELLIVMAILGVLAVVVLVAINPAEQLARTRDAGRVSSVTQLGHGVQAFYTAHNAVYPNATTWGNDLANSGEVTAIPSAITATGYTACGTAATNGWCFATSTTNTVVFARLESKSYGSKCSGSTAYVLFSAIEGRGGTVCSSGDPGISATYVFVP